MAFSYTVDGSTVQGTRKAVWGTFTNGDADTGGDIVTGVTNVHEFSLSFTSHKGSNNPKHTVGATGTVTIVTDYGADGIWSAVGY